MHRIEILHLDDGMHLVVVIGCVFCVHCASYAANLIVTDLL